MNNTNNDRTYPPSGQFWPDRPPAEGERMIGNGRLLYPVGTIVNRPEGRFVVGEDLILRRADETAPPEEKDETPGLIRVEIRSPWPRHCGLVKARLIEAERDGHGHQVEIVKLIRGDPKTYSRGMRLDHVVRTFGAWGCGPRWHMNQCDPQECTCKPAGEI